MFMEQYVLFMMQDKLSANGELERLHIERIGEAEQDKQESEVQFAELSKEMVGRYYRKD